MNLNGIKTISNVITYLMKLKLDVVSKLIVFTIVGLPLAIIGIVWATICLVKNLDLNTSNKGVKKKAKKLPSIPPTDRIYYEVKKFTAKNCVLTQYVKFYVAQEHDFLDVTESMQQVYSDMKYYHGKSEDLVGSAVLVDYDIVQLQKNMGDVNLVRTIM